MLSLAGWEIGDWEIAEEAAEWIELVAVIVIVVALIIALGSAVKTRFRGSTPDAIRAFKRQISRGLLIGLDLLIAADIIRTVTLDATRENVIVLGILVVVRTFLAWTLIVEAEGRWPWQRPGNTPIVTPGDAASRQKPPADDDAVV